jgi:hypothetical protein
VDKFSRRPRRDLWWRVPQSVPRTARPLAWARRPRPGPHGLTREPGRLACRPLLASTSRVSRVVGWAEPPNPVAGLTAVPDWGARPFARRPFLSGAYATGCGPVPAPRPTPRSAGSDMSRTFAVYVPILAIKGPVLAWWGRAAFGTRCRATARAIWRRSPQPRHPTQARSRRLAGEY